MFLGIWYIKHLNEVQTRMSEHIALENDGVLTRPC